MCIVKVDLCDGFFEPFPFVRKSKIEHGAIHCGERVKYYSFGLLQRVYGFLVGSSGLGNKYIFFVHFEVCTFSLVDGGSFSVV